ncbi:MAG TPA: DUF4838 domain-containing protein, partial [Candidatus Paenibacillus intestinavium]|nr:DUF4838 domain-containing protein [Candidatus Paenibacillus intestinavium]
MNGNVLVKRMLVLLLGLVVFLGGTPLYANANTTDNEIKLQDHNGHWAENTLERWINQEDLIGYADGTVRPNQVLTRGELMVFINRIIGLEETAELSFSDLSKDSSLYSDVAKAVKAGYVHGRPDGTIGVNEPVTRQEVAVMIARVLGIPEQSNDEALLFNDGGMIATWSKSAISELVNLGILRGYADNSFQPSRYVTRAEAIVSLDRVLAQMEQQYIITKPGIYDFSDIQHTLNWDIIIYSFGVTLRNVSIEGDLILSNGVSPLDVNLENAEIKGNTIDRNNVGTPAVTLTPTSNNDGGSNNGGNNNGGEEELPEQLALVVSGEGKAVVVTEETASQQVVDAAESLIEYVYKSTGATLPLLDADEAELLTNNELLINVGFIGDGADDTAITQQLIDLDNDGFVIFPEYAANIITIIGPTDWGTEFGIYEFLERFIGVWWLLPGPEGEDVPLHTDILIEEELVRQEPTFFSRAYDSNIENTVARKAWTRHNRIHNRMDHDHSFWKILPPSQYQSIYPDFYPTNNGLLTSHGGWQICFSVPQTVDVVSDMILDFFEQNPDKDSFSLSVNDNGGFCEQDPTHPLYPNKINSIGYQDMSNIYFEWVDKVADIVFAQYPDKYIGTIAYHEVYEPPTNVTLHPNVIVYITDERLAWADQDMETAGKAFTEKWLTAAPGVAFYEYLYGTPYSLPRPYIHQMSENYKYAAQVGVNAQFTELYPNFGEGPKAWIASRLQWDASADVDVLLDEWYTRAVGAEAASYLAAYFEHWENFWEVRVIESTWFEKWVNTNPRRNFMNFYDSTYFKEVTASDIEYSRSLMDSVVDKAATPEQQARANVLMQAFEYYEASALSYPSDGPIVPITTDEEAETLLDQMIIKLSKAEYRLQLFDSFATHEILQQPLNPRNYGQAWSGIRSKEVDLLIQWVKANTANDTFKTYVLDTVTEVESEQVRNYLKFILAEASDQVALNVNTSFEDGITGSIDDTPPWWYWVDYGQDEDNVHQSDIIARTGDYSVEAVGMKIGGPVIDNIEVSPGFHSLSAYYYVPAGSQSNGNISLFMNFWDANGTHLGNAITTNVLARESAGEWALIEWVGEIPEKIGGVPVKKVQFGANIFDFEDNQLLYLDDFRLLRLSDLYIPEDDDEEEQITINHNSSFEYGNVGSDDALPWSYWIDGGVGT